MRQSTETEHDRPSRTFLWKVPHSGPHSRAGVRHLFLLGGTGGVLLPSLHTSHRGPWVGGTCGGGTGTSWLRTRGFLGRPWFAVSAGEGSGRMTSAHRLVCRRCAAGPHLAVTDPRLTGTRLPVAVPVRC